ncbi:MAG: VWA domain-containing protein [Planctomycetes bacterium]|nr:VWA domain-containing protein [Planctomycetota bacterium]
MSALMLLQTLGEQKGTGAAEWHVWGDYYLANPWCLAVLPLGLLAFAWGRVRAGRAAARVSVLPTAALPRSWPQRLTWLVASAQLVALLLATVALARPVRANEQRTIDAEGVDILCAVDRSGSMQYPDLDPKLNRLEVVKQVVGAFAARRMRDEVGAQDNVGLLVFARYPELLCPSTLDVDALTGFLKSVELVKYEAEDGTAIGRALAKCVAVMRGSESKSKVVVLLTDGENNLDDITPAAAAKLAAEAGVKVYTILAGKFVYQPDVFGRPRPMQRELDTTDLERIAKDTGGRFFRARDEAELEKTYAEIERLERTPREERRFVETFDLYRWFLEPALALYLIAWISASTWARRVA